MFFYLVTTGKIFDISLCENSINQFKNNNKMTLRDRGDGNLGVRNVKLSVPMIETLSTIMVSDSFHFLTTMGLQCLMRSSASPRTQHRIRSTGEAKNV